MARILFVTDQWGYGTTTCATSIAAALKGRYTRWLIGDGVGYTLATRDSFDGCIPANTMADSPPEALKEAIRESRVVVSVMNSNAAEVADDLGIPCVYVDTLLWMWARPPILPFSIARYFAVGFPGVKYNAVRWKDSLPRTEVVTPLIAPSRSLDPGAYTDVLVNFGGLSSPLVSQASLITYAQTMVDCIIKALADWPGRITVSMGEHILNPIDRARLHVARSDVRFVNLSHAEYLTQLEHSRFLISSPGLSATHEAFGRGIPCLLLPSQNLSQILTVQILERAGAAFSLDWDAMYGLTGLTAKDQPRACLRIAECIDRFRRDGLARGRLVRHLKAQLAPDNLERIAATQAAFFEPNQGRHGAHEVADYVRHLVSPTSAKSSIPDPTLATAGVVAAKSD
jgi:hypothetical protein